MEKQFKPMHEGFNKVENTSDILYNMISSVVTHIPDKFTFKINCETN